jgi:cysteine desulfurase
LLLASAVALEEWRKEAADCSVRLRSLNTQIRQAFTRINNSFIAGNLDDSMGHLISASFDDVEGEELLRALEVDGISVDSGSACSADNLRPSHVLASMGLPTHGNVRITLHPEITDSEVVALIESVRRNVEILRK